MRRSARARRRPRRPRHRPRHGPRHRPRCRAMPGDTPTASAVRTPAPAAGLTLRSLGAGRVVTATARQALTAGYEVLIATGRPPAEIEMIVDVVVPGARAVNAETA